MPDVKWYGTRRTATFYTDAIILDQTNQDVWLTRQAAGVARITTNGSTLGTFAAAAFAVGTTPASAGGIRLTNSDIIYARNYAGNGDISLLYLNGSNQIILGESAVHVSPAGAGVSDFGDIPNGNWWRSVYIASWYATTTTATNPTSSNLPNATGFAVYCKGNKFVIAYYNSGNQIRYKTILLDGATTSWVDTTTAP